MDSFYQIVKAYKMCQEIEQKIMLFLVDMHYTFNCSPHKHEVKNVSALRYKIV